ncbi:MAG: hypothetical protein IKF07_00240 [Eubacterium sp.]|nr:hypothetical protein [Eubacterium sp.]
MNDQEKEIQKYKEQGFKKKKKHQLAPEPEKYKIDQSKMIGSPDMLTEEERRNFTMNAMARHIGVVGILAIIIGPLGTLLSLGVAEMVYSKYVLGASFEAMIAAFYRPYIYACTGVFFGIVFIAWLVYHFAYVNKKDLIIRADDKIVEAGMEPVEIPRLDKDRNSLIEAFYHLKVPYKAAYVLIAAALVVLIVESVVVFRAGAEQKIITDKARAEVSERIEESLEGFDHTSESKIMSFVDRHTYTINDHLKMIIDIDENGKVLDSSYMLRYSAKYDVAQLDKLKSEGVRKEFEDVHATTKAYSDLFVYPTVTEVPVQFSDYMLNYIDNIREKSEWEGEQETTVGSDDYIMHCKVKYSEGKDKAGKDDDKMTVSYEIQLKNFKRTQW